ENQVVSAIISALLLTSISGMLFSAIAYKLMFREGYTILLISLALLTIPMRLSAIYAGGIFLGKEQIKRSNLMNWLTGLLTLFFGLVFVWILKMKITGALLSLMLGNLIVSFIAINMLYKDYEVKLSFANPIIVRLLKLGVIYALSFLVIQLNYRVDVLLLQWLSDARQIGLYSLGVSVSELLWQIPLAVSIVVMSRTANTTNLQKTNEDTAKLLRISLLLGVVLSLFIYILSPYIIPWVFGEKFRQSVLIVQTIMPGIIMVIIFRILSGQLSGMGKPLVALKAFVPALILNVILNYFLIPEHGGLGAAIATNVSYMVGTIIYTIAYCRITGTTPGKLFHYSMNDFLFIKEKLQRYMR
ncbi:MAG: polysaccharide biosynthesis C-terminal domain-containing protein, partial [Lentimicrobiaceae bacterium]